MLGRIVALVALVGCAFLLEAALPLAPYRAAAPNPAGPPALRDLQLLTENEGWLLAGSDLYWTHTGGRTWARITPASPGDWAMQAAFFLDTHRGWAVLTGEDAAGQVRYALARTADTGETWQITPLALFRPGDPRAYPAAVYLSFLDNDTGWLVVKRATGSNFSAGTLFRTLAGGSTWTERSLSIGEPVYFLTAELGWAAGGAAGDEFYRTGDGGATWSRSGPDPLGDGAVRRQMLRPVFQDGLRGTLPVVVTEGDEARVELYVTRDAGRTWHLSARVPLGHGLGPAPRIPIAVFDEEQWMLASPTTGGVMRGPEWPQATTGTSGLPEGTVRLHMPTPEVGWAVQAAGDCRPGAALPASIECTQTQALLRTSDGRRTWQAASLPASEPLLPSPTQAALPGAKTTASQTEVYAGQGFDSCTMPSLSQMETWLASSPYGVWNLYLGGSARANCGTLTEPYVSQLAQQGWKFIPTWVGPQAACSGFASRMSLDPAQAYDHGVAEASAAVEAAVSLGLAAPDGSGTVIYYDLEAYGTTDAACRIAAQAFISGWAAQMHARGDQAGVYGSSCGSALSDLAGIPNVPDAIWAAAWLLPYKYRSNASVWGLPCLDDTLWSNSQRIHQYAGGHDETWGAVTLNIDSNVFDGIVAVGQAPPADTTPPVATWVSPQDGQTVDTPSLRLEASASDDSSGVSRVDLSAAWDGQWHAPATLTSAPYVYDWDLCSARFPDGDVELGLEA